MRGLLDFGNCPHDAVAMLGQKTAVSLEFAQKGAGPKRALLCAATRRDNSLRVVKEVQWVDTGPGLLGERAPFEEAQHPRGCETEVHGQAPSREPHLGWMYQPEFQQALSLGALLHAIRTDLGLGNHPVRWCVAEHDPTPVERTVYEPRTAAAAVFALDQSVVRTPSFAGTSATGSLTEDALPAGGGLAKVVRYTDREHGHASGLEVLRNNLRAARDTSDAPILAELVAHGTVGRVYIGNEWFEASTIGELLADYGVIVAVLAVCHGSDSALDHDGQSPGSSTAAQVVAAGVPAVVAWTGKIWDSWAEPFHSGFRDAILKGASGDQAMRSGRLAMDEIGVRLLWSAVTMHTSTEDLVLQPDRTWTPESTDEVERRAVVNEIRNVEAAEFEVVHKGDHNIVDGVKVRGKFTAHQSN